MIWSETLADDACLVTLWNVLPIKSELFYVF